MAWSFFYSSKWALASLPGWMGDTTLLALVLAVSVSVVAFFFIFILDKLADADWTPESVDKMIVEIIGALGIQVGFAWEQTFDASVAALASHTGSPVLMKLVLGMICAFFIVPAWKNYMLPMIIEEGWRYGFIATRVTRYMDEDDDETMRHYYDQLKHLLTGHKKHADNNVEALDLKNKLIDLIKAQIASLEDDPDGNKEDDGYIKLPSN